jgi:hypothetical protein
MSGDIRCKIRCTKRLLVGGVVALTLFVGTEISVVGPASAQTTKTVQVARCSKATTGHSNLTKANVTDCRSAALVQLRCDSGPSIGIVKVKGVAYALRQGSRPLRMGNNYRVVQLAKLCISPPPAPTTTTTVPPTTTTTTVTVPPTTTPPTAPPTTAPPTTSPPPTAAPASSCSPTASSGNCYSAGEYCSNADHGVSGTAGNGEAITCEDNNGWRWEPS